MMYVLLSYLYLYNSSSYKGSAARAADAARYARARQKRLVMMKCKHRLDNAKRFMVQRRYSGLDRHAKHARDAHIISSMLQDNKKLYVRKRKHSNTAHSTALGWLLWV